MRGLFLVLVFLACGTWIAGASLTVMVTTNVDSHAASPGTSPNDANNKVSLRSAIEYLNTQSSTKASANTVNVPPGTYSLTLGEIQIGDTAAVQGTVINGTGTAANTIVKQNDTINRIFNNDPNVSGGISTTISNLTMSNGQDSNDHFGGGAILTGGAGDSLTTINCVFVNDRANVVGNSSDAPGGAVSSSGGGSLVITGCTFTNCNAGSSRGGALFHFPESATDGATITGCLFINNKTADLLNGGGAISLEQGDAPTPPTFTISNCIFSGNLSSNAGGVADGAGAIFLDGGLLTVTACSFLSNQASIGYGGAMAVPNGSVTVRYCRFVGNTSSPGKGAALAVYTANGASMTADNNWWGDNTGPASGTAVEVTSTGGAQAALPVANWMLLTHTGNPASIVVGGTATLTASFLKNSAGNTLTAANVTALAGVPITFGNAVDGALSGAQTKIQASGTATATFTATTTGAGSANAAVDNAIAAATINITAPPVFTSANHTNFTAGNPGSFTVTTSGVPIPTLHESGLIPSNLVFNAATGILNGTPASGTGGSYPLVFTATNAAGTNTQDFTLNVNEAPSINCPADLQTNASGGECVPPSVSFAATAKGFPAPAITYKLGANAIASPAIFPIGTNIVTSTAANAVGTNSCSFNVVVAPGAEPELSIVSSGTNVVVSWPDVFTCYTLEFAPALPGNGWSVFPGPFTTNGGFIFVTNSAIASNKFFRLTH